MSGLRAGFDKSYRCGACGGFWVEGWVANRVAEGQMKDLPRVEAKAEKFGQKNDLCPMDSTPLLGLGGEEVPPDVVAYKCSHCGWWWFPLDNLFKFKRAYEAKASYLKFWHKKSEARMLVLPVLLVLALTVTLGVSVASIRKRQLVETKAAEVEEFRVNYWGGGKAEIQFKTGKNLEYVLMKRVEDEYWGPVEVKMMGEGGYKVTLEGMEEKRVYTMQVAGRRFYFQAK